MLINGVDYGNMMTGKIRYEYGNCLSMDVYVENLGCYVNIKVPSDVIDPIIEKAITDAKRILKEVEDFGSVQRCERPGIL